MSLIDTRALTFLHRLTRSTAPLLPQEVQAARGGLASLRLQAVWYRRLAWLGAAGSFGLFWLGSNQHGWWLMLVLALLLVPLAWGVSVLEKVTARGLQPMPAEQLAALQAQWGVDSAAGRHLQEILDQGREPLVADSFALRKLTESSAQGSEGHQGSPQS